MSSNKILYKVAILSTLLALGILSNGGNLVQAQTPPASITPPVGGTGTITTATTTIPSNVTALNVYDNSTMVLEFGNGTTLTSPYSNVWSILFLPASNQTIANTTTGGGTTPDEAAVVGEEEEDEAAVVGEEEEDEAAVVGEEEEDEDEVTFGEEEEEAAAAAAAAAPAAEEEAD
jgi:hypothetical protein